MMYPLHVAMMRQGETQPSQPLPVAVRHVGKWVRGTQISFISFSERIGGGGEGREGRIAGCWKTEIRWVK